MPITRRRNRGGGQIIADRRAQYQPRDSPDRIATSDIKRPSAENSATETNRLLWDCLLSVSSETAFVGKDAEKRTAFGISTLSNSLVLKIPTL
jgi:hypothetical protein